MNANTSTTANMPTFTAIRRNFLNTHTARKMRPFVLLGFSWAKRRYFEALVLRDELDAVSSGGAYIDNEPSKLWH